MGKIKLIENFGLIFLCLIIVLSTINCQLLTNLSILPSAFPQEDNLVVKGRTQTQTLTLPGGNSFPLVPPKGTLFYRSNEKKFYTFNGATWDEVGIGGVGGAGKLAVATRIVAASNSLDKDRADYVCDGTDDQVEIQKAIDDLPSSGGSVYLLEGTYNISAPININKSNVTLMGAGAATVLNLTTDKAIQSSNVSRVVLSQLRMKYNGDYSCWFKNISYSLLEKLWLEGCKIYIVLSYLNTITENFFSPPHKGRTFQIVCGMPQGGGDIGGNIIYNNIFTTANPASEIIRTIHSSNNIAIGNLIKGDFNVLGMHITSGSSHNIIVGNRILEVKYGIVVQGYSSTPSTDNIFSSNIISGLSASFSKGIRLDNVERHTDRQIISSNFISNFSDGIEVDKVHNSLLVGNILYNYASSGSGYGIVIPSDYSKNNYFVGNFISGYSKPINDKGKNTKYTDKLKMTLEKREVKIEKETSSYNLDVLTNPQSYVQLNPTKENITLTLSDGKSPGDLLILENISSYKITIEDSGNVNLAGDRKYKFL